MQSLHKVLVRVGELIKFRQLVSHPVALGLQVAVVVLAHLNGDRNAIHDVQAVAVESHTLGGVISDELRALDTKICLLYTSDAADE